MDRSGTEEAKGAQETSGSHQTRVINTRPCGSGTYSRGTFGKWGLISYQGSIKGAHSLLGSRSVSSSIDCSESERSISSGTAGESEATVFPLRREELGLFTGDVVRKFSRRKWVWLTERKKKSKRRRACVLGEEGVCDLSAEGFLLKYPSH